LALNLELGRWMWWPGRLFRRGADEPRGPVTAVAPATVSEQPAAPELPPVPQQRGPGSLEPR
jgi:hypothetical protein